MATESAADPATTGSGGGVGGAGITTLPSRTNARFSVILLLTELVVLMSMVSPTERP